MMLSGSVQGLPFQCLSLNPTVPLLLSMDKNARNKIINHNDFPSERARWDYKQSTCSKCITSCIPGKPFFFFSNFSRKSLI